MNGQSDFSNRCPHCGYWLPPNQAGPCPNCGRELRTVLLTTPTAIPVVTVQSASGKSYVLRLTEPFGIQEKLANIVNASGAAAFSTHHESLPAWWGEGVKTMTQDIFRSLPEVLPPILEPVLEKHEKEREAKEKNLTNRIRKITEDITNPGTWFWMIITAIVSYIVVWLIFGHS